MADSGHTALPLSEPDALEQPAAVAGASCSSVALEVSNTRSSLRLPSFEALGIANPHPDKPRSPTPATACAYSTSMASREAKLPRRGPPANINHAHTLLPLAAHLISTLTPPTESHGIAWASTEKSSHHTSAGSGSGSMHVAEQVISREDSFLTPHPTPHNQHISFQDSSYNSPWLDPALEVLFSDLSPPSSHHDQTLKVLSHALPCPSTEGHVFTRVMSALYDNSSSRTTTWINVFHALPGRFNLVDLPRSPPTTPGQPFQGEDYFTQKVFDTAVTVADYHTDLSLLPRSPRPAVPPGSVNLAIVERYIPPTSTLEFVSMFDVNAPSILVDRLVELSPGNGTLLFIYPTRSGAKTFAQDYLAPVLDPLLRSLAMLHGLPMAFCDAVGRLPVIDQMLDYDELESRMRQLCSQLSKTSRSSHSISSRYEMVHASTGLVHPMRSIWASKWWIKQEKERLREQTSRWTQDAQSRRKADTRGVERSVASAEVLGQLFSGLDTRSYPAGQPPNRGIEVGVFVIRRTQ